MSLKDRMLEIIKQHPEAKTAREWAKLMGCTRNATRLALFTLYTEGAVNRADALEESRATFVYSRKTA